MHVFITGVAGFLGSHLADALLAAGHRVTGIDSLIGGDRANVPSGVRFVEADCNSLDVIRALMVGSDVVYHLAATPHEGLSVFSPHENAKNGYLACAAVFSAACSTSVKRVVYASSMARYGANVVPFTEDMEPRPQDPYAIGKAAGEQLLRTLCSTHDVEFAIAIPHSIVGPRQRFSDPYRNVASIFANMMLQDRHPFIYGDGLQKRCFSFIPDVVGPLVALGTEPQCAGEVINIGPDEEFITILDLAERIARIVGVKFAPVMMPDRPQEVRLATCSSNKARKLLGYKTTISLDGGLRQLVDWIREQGPKPFEYHLGLEIVNDNVPETWNRRLF
jgi:UDP-glucose 4-epimerase